MSNEGKLTVVVEKSIEGLPGATVVVRLYKTKGPSVVTTQTYLNGKPKTDEVGVGRPVGDSQWDWTTMMRHCGYSLIEVN